MVVLFVIMIVIVIIAVFLLMQYLRAVRLPKQSIVAFTGTLGSGKTYLAVKNAVKEYNKQNLKYKIYMLLSWLPRRDKLLKSWKYSATMYSNIPVRISKSKLSTPLVKEDLLERGRLPEKCVVLIDEIGQFASQWDFDNPKVQENLATFIRFFRHWLDGKMFVTDQVADNIVKPIRSRLGMIYNLHDFRRWAGVLPFYKVTAIPLLLIEDNTNAVESSTNEAYEDSYFFGYLPYRKNKNNKYQSRCYKPIYTSTALRNIDHFDDNLYTRYLIDITVSKDMQKDYKANRDKYKSYLYDEAPKLINEPISDDEEKQEKASPPEDYPNVNI